MAPKPKAGGTKKPPGKKPKMTQKEQSRAFIEKAREIGVDESGMEFETAFGKVTSKKRSRDPQNAK